MSRRIAETVAELAGSLGTAEGLSRITHEIGHLCESLGARPLGFSREELVEMDRALTALSAGMFELDRAVRTRIRQLCGEGSHAE